MRKIIKKLLKQGHLLPDIVRRIVIYYFTRYPNSEYFYFQEKKALLLYIDVLTCLIKRKDIKFWQILKNVEKEFLPEKEKIFNMWKNKQLEYQEKDDDYYKDMLQDLKYYTDENIVKKQLQLY